MSEKFVISVELLTATVIGRWLTLDALLDGILEFEGIPEEDRRLPLRAWDGEEWLDDLTSGEARDMGACFAASALIAEMGQGRGPGGLSLGQPDLRPISLIGGVRPVQEFLDASYPYEASGRKHQVSRGPAGLVKSTRITLAPGRVNWMAQGDLQASLDILRRARGIGAKANIGFGQFDPASLAFEVAEEASETFGMTDFDGEALMRPVPFSVSEKLGLGPGTRLSGETCWAPYWDRSRVVPAKIPVTPYLDGLITL